MRAASLTKEKTNICVEIRPDFGAFMEHSDGAMIYEQHQEPNEFNVRECSAHGFDETQL